MAKNDVAVNENSTRTTCAEIKFRAPRAIEAMPSPSLRLLDGVEVTRHRGVKVTRHDASHLIHRLMSTRLPTVSDRNWRVAAKEPIAAARHANVYKIAIISAMIVVKTPRGSDAFRALLYSCRT